MPSRRDDRRAVARRRSRQEARAGDHVELGVRAQVRRAAAGMWRAIVLPVAVDLDGDVVAVLERVLVAGLHGAADPEVERVADDAGAGGRARGGWCRRSSRRRRRGRRSPARARGSRRPSRRWRRLRCRRERWRGACSCVRASGGVESRGSSIRKNARSGWRFRQPHRAQASPCPPGNEAQHAGVQRAPTLPTSCQPSQATRLGGRGIVTRLGGDGSLACAAPRERSSSSSSSLPPTESRGRWSPHP